MVTRTCQSYGAIARKEVVKTFFKRFLDTIKTNLTKYFGEEESKRVIETLAEGRVKILNIENFLYSPFNTSDRTLEFYASRESADDFFYKSLDYFKRVAESGSSYIEVREFFLAFIDMIQAEKLSEEQVEWYIKMLLSTFKNSTHESSFYIQLLSPRFRDIVKEKLGLSLVKYSTFAPIFFETYKSMPQDPVYKREFFPKVETLHPVFPDIRDNQMQYVATLYSIPKTHAYAAFREVPNPIEDNTASNIALNALEKETGKVYNRESIFLEFDRIRELNPQKMYPETREFSDIFKQLGVRKATFNMKDFRKTCVNSELFTSCLQPYYSHIEIDCAGLKLEDLNYYIDSAKSLSLIRVYFFNYVKEQYSDGNEKFKITLKNVQDLSQELVKFIHNKTKQLKSYTNKDFLIDVYYDPEVIGQKFDKSKEQYIRVISDIHADYNDNRYAYNFGEDFIINCGDTAGDARTCIDWCKNHMKHGVVVAGNHLGYGKCFPELDKMDFKNTKGKQMNIIAANFTGGNTPTMFLSNTVTEHEGIIILGTTLFTDFALYGEEHIEEAKKYAKDNMNDFRVVTVAGHRNYTKDENGKWDKGWKPRTEEWETRLFTPQDHAYYFDHSLNFLKDKVEEYKDSPIIIVTHHAPTPYAISPQYAGSMLNPAFASNLNEFIVNNPQIRLWCHGHVHNKSDIILRQTRVVCDPFGYNNENNADLPYNYGTRIKVADVKSKRPWTDICSEEIKFGLIKTYEN